jgi:putative addiction module CopG family antidote
MNISLSPELERLIAEKVRSGQYRSVDEVIRQGLELLQAREAATHGAASATSISLVDVFGAIASDVPESEWAHLPSDLSKNLDRYLYGS